MATRERKSPQTTSGRPLTARAVAELCGVELKTVHNWAAEGRLAHFRTPGRHLRFSPQAVQAFLDECGYENATAGQPNVVCVQGQYQTRLRRILARTQCSWKPDVEGALIECGRRPPHVLVVDGSHLMPRALLISLRALRRELPQVQVVVVFDGKPPRTAAAEGIVWGGLQDVRRVVDAHRRGGPASSLTSR